MESKYHILRIMISGSGRSPYSLTTSALISRPEDKTGIDKMIPSINTHSTQGPAHLTTNTLNKRNVLPHGIERKPHGFDFTRCDVENGVQSQYSVLVDQLDIT